jgi:hypothetical protein
VGESWNTVADVGESWNTVADVEESWNTCRWRGRELEHRRWLVLVAPCWLNVLHCPQPSRALLQPPEPPHFPESERHILTPWEAFCGFWPRAVVLWWEQYHQPLRWWMKSQSTPSPTPVTRKSTTGINIQPPLRHPTGKWNRKAFYINQNTREKMGKKVAQDLWRCHWLGLSNLNNFRDPLLYKSVSTLT